MNLVCPSCGWGEFSAILTTRTEYTYNFDQRLGTYEIRSELYEGGDLDEVDEFTCTDCGALVVEDDLVTEEDYLGEELEDEDA